MVKVYAKEIAGGVVAGLSSLITALGDNALSYQEIATVALAFVLGLGIVAAVPAKPSGGGV
jgi:hypothetical protein